MIKRDIFVLLSKLKGTYYGNEYNQIKEISNEEKLLDIQTAHLKKLLLHAYRNVPFYTERLKNVIEDDKAHFDGFNRIPLLTKEDLRKYGKLLTSKDMNTRKWHYNSSGGSTGEPVTFIQDGSFEKWASATLKHYYEDIVDIDETTVKKILLWGSEREIFGGNMGLRAKVFNWLTNTVVLNSFRMTEGDMKRYAKIINSYKPDLIRGYAGSLYELCKFAERKELPIYSPKVVVAAAETLHKEMRAKIEGVFGTKVYDFYGTREVGPIAAECKYGVIHVFLFNNYVEITDNHNKPVRENQEGKVIVTNLHNYSMPFIRYEIGDMAVLGPKECRCKSQYPTLKKITGRVIEHFIRKDGTVIPGEFFIHLIGVVCNKGFIRKFQVVQEDYERIRLLIVPEETVDEHSQREIENKIRLVMGNEGKIIWEFVDEIPKLKTGKYLYTRSLIDRT